MTSAKYLRVSGIRGLLTSFSVIDGKAAYWLAIESKTLAKQEAK